MRSSSSRAMVTAWKVATARDKRPPTARPPATRLEAAQPGSPYRGSIRIRSGSTGRSGAPTKRVHADWDVPQTGTRNRAASGRSRVIRHVGGASRRRPGHRGRCARQRAASPAATGSRQRAWGRLPERQVTRPRPAGGRERGRCAAAPQHGQAGPRPGPEQRGDGVPHRSSSPPEARRSPRTSRRAVICGKPLARNTRTMVIDGAVGEHRSGVAASRPVSA